MVDGHPPLHTLEPQICGYKTKAKVGTPVSVPGHSWETRGGVGWVRNPAALGRGERAEGGQVRRWRERAETHKQRGSCSAEGALGGAERGLRLGEERVKPGQPHFSVSPDTPAHTHSSPSLAVLDPCLLSPPYPLGVSAGLPAAPSPAPPPCALLWGRGSVEVPQAALGGRAWWVGRGRGGAGQARAPRGPPHGPPCPPPAAPLPPPRPPPASWAPPAF